MGAAPSAHLQAATSNRGAGWLQPPQRAWVRWSLGSTAAPRPCKACGQDGGENSEPWVCRRRPLTQGWVQSRQVPPGGAISISQASSPLAPPLLQHHLTPGDPATAIESWLQSGGGLWEAQQGGASLSPVGGFPFSAGHTEGNWSRSSRKGEPKAAGTSHHTVFPGTLHPPALMKDRGRMLLQAWEGWLICAGGWPVARKGGATPVSWET